MPSLTTVFNSQNNSEGFSAGWHRHEEGYSFETSSTNQFETLPRFWLDALTCFRPKTVLTVGLSFTLNMYVRPENLAKGKVSILS